MIDKYQNLVFTICYRYVNDYFEAEDLAQETFLSVYKNLSRFDMKEEKAWICKIAVNKCIDFKRRKERQSLPTEYEFFESVVDNRPSPEEKFLQDEVMDRLFTACNTLKEPYKQAAIDYFYNGYSPPDISKSRGINIKTVQTHIYRAKEMLRKIYREAK